MKKLIIFCFALLILSCSDEPKDHTPVLTKVVIAPTDAMIEAGNDATEFNTDDFIRFHYTVEDSKADFDKAVISKTDENGAVSTGEYPYQTFVIITGTAGKPSTKTSSTITYPQNSFDVGSWSISVYYLDKAGNKSDTVTKSFTVVPAFGD